MGLKTYLLGDVGGTNSRLAIYRADYGIARFARYKNADFRTLAELIRTYLATLSSPCRASVGCFAIAGPVAGEEFHLTNLDWCFSRSSLCRELALAEVHVINDFTAIALAIPELKTGDVLTIHPGDPKARGTLGIVGAGTGLGVSGLLWQASGPIPISGEGGHVTLSASNELEANLIGYLRARLEHVSAEKVLSGPGLLNLYQAVAHLNGEQPTHRTPEEITASRDALAQTTMKCFFSLLGSFCGNLALTLGARGGIYLAGGILPQMGNRLQGSCFVEAFIDKGRCKGYLAAIPIHLITYANPALLGLARYALTH